MDENNQKNLTLGDILDQLTKPTVIQGIGQDSIKSPATSPTTRFSPPLPGNRGEINLPSLGGSVDKSPISDELQSQSANQKAEISLSIRTMADDLARLKQGQNPSPIELKKVIQKEPVVKQDTPPPVPPTPEISEENIAARPVIEPPSLRRPTPPVPRQLPPSRPEQSTGEPTKPFRIPPIFSRDKDQLLPSLPRKNQFSTPQKQADAFTQEERPEYRVIARVIGSGLTTGILITVAIAVIAYFLLSLFVFNKDETMVTATPTPTFSPVNTENPTNNELAIIFSGMSAFNFFVPDGTGDITPQLKTNILSDTINKGEFKIINMIMPAGQDERKKSFSGFLNIFGINYPADLGNLTNGNYLALIYGQSELFNDAGQILANSQVLKRIVLIAEVNNKDRADTMLRAWEISMASDFEGIFDIDPAKEASNVFLDNIRGNSKIRYKNFPRPDKSIDYSLITSLTGKSYIIISNSRESMYSPMDRIMGL